MPSPSPPKGSSPRKGRKGVKAFKALSAKRGGGRGQAPGEYQSRYEESSGAAAAGSPTNCMFQSDEEKSSPSR